MQNSVAPTSQRSTSFPRCNLHGVSNVDRLPPRCPLNSPAPFRTVAAIRECAFEFQSPAEHEVADTCGVCVPGMLRHPIVKAVHDVR